jgi:hypothetical protein
MRKNISQVIETFKQGKPLRVDSVHTDGKKIYSYNLVIAERDEKGDVWVTDESDSTSKTDTTRIRACQITFLGRKVRDKKLPDFQEIPTTGCNGMPGMSFLQIQKGISILLPNATWGEDSDGQLIIYTNLRENGYHVEDMDD